MNRPTGISPPSLPRATYRLQFNRDFPLRRAIELVPYLHDLGISHLYASPLLKAGSGSTHGYDVCDFSRINPEIGTEAELEDLVATLRRHDMGLVLDFVPNHMGIGPENLWWWDVLKKGRASRFAEYFDINWDPGDLMSKDKVLVPVLGEDLERVLERGELKVALEGNEPVLRYFEHRFPVAPGSLEPAQKPVAATISQLNSHSGALAALIQAQHYRLVNWRDGDRQLNYRRFFNVTTLAGIRIEDPRVFEAAHAKVFDWLARGYWDGIRIDHPDGLRDPLQYLQRLRAAAPQAWIVVEKILEPGETLPRDWPVAGTTGYDFLNQVNGLFVASSGEAPLTDFYAEFTGEPTDYFELVRQLKHRALRQLLVAETNQLVRRLESIARRHERHFAGDTLREALIELIACFPVYRTYVQAGDANSGSRPGVSPADFQSLELAVASARRAQPGLDPALLDFLGDLLRLRINGDEEREFAMRFQQLTGPAMAKGVEDTTFYRFNRFIALNEVGGDPGHFGSSLEQFHERCLAAQAHWPHAMLSSSTHDTKRSEDVRARLDLLSEIPGQWIETVRRWATLNQRHRTGNFPDRNTEYFYYQTLVGAWPVSLERLLAYVEKASCEAGRHTEWNHRNNEYDRALKHFVTATVNDEAFVRDLESFIATLAVAAQVNSLAQTLIKLTAPGVPDIYQGNELWDFSLVDPDNRRPVDFALRRRLAAEARTLSAEAAWSRRDEGLPKLWLIQKTLAWRARYPEVFAGSYQPWMARGAKANPVVAFLRGDRAMTVVPRFTLDLKMDPADATLELPPGNWRNEFTGKNLSGKIAAGELFKMFPVALVMRKDTNS